MTNTTPARVLHGHTTPETAHLTYEYPFGHNRCVRREWLEYRNGHGYRLVTQTTVRPFNYDYTERLQRDGADLANAWARETLGNLAAKSTYWNAPKASTYTPILAIMTEEPLSDESGRLGISWRGIGHSLEDAENLQAELGDQLDADETKTLDDYLTYHRAYKAAVAQAEAQGMTYPETARLGTLAGRKALIEKNAPRNAEGN